MSAELEISSIAELRAQLESERLSRSQLEVAHRLLAARHERLLARLEEVEASRSWRWTNLFRQLRYVWRHPRKVAVKIFRVACEQAQFIVRHPRKAAIALLRRASLAPLSRTKRIGLIGRGLDVDAPRRFRSLAGGDVSLAGHVSETPRVSVIIPVYGQLEVTLRCLDSIRAAAPRCQFEVIVVDDCSPDGSVNSLASIPGLRFVRNQENLGFLRSCNRAASLALGEYLCFLNNDTEVQVGWLDALLRTFDEFPGCGLVGSKLLNDDGSLQEAGGIVWRDGSAWNFGRGHDPRHCTYNYAREVDYCSGASIMVPAALFAEVGGFDELYLPAYCEDTDLAIRLRHLGYRVIYQPRSEVLHLEGVTSGRDTSKGVKAYQVTNMKKLFDRWQAVLASHEPAGQLVDRAKDRGHRGRVLVIDHLIPTPDRDSGSVDAYNLMLVLRDFGYQVTFASDDGLRFDQTYTPALERVGVEVLYQPHVPSVGAHLAAHGHRYDLVILMRPSVMKSHIDSVRRWCPLAKVIFHTVDLHFLRMARQAEIERSESLVRESERMRDLELKLIDLADLATVVGTQELELLRDRHHKSNVRALPFSRHVRGTVVPFEKRAGAVFVGGFRHPPNVDAVQWLVREVMPLVWERNASFTLHIVGSDAPTEVTQLASDRVWVHGFIADLDPVLDRCLVSVAPLRYGAGIKGKVGYAMSVGLPSVATSVAVEGMELNAGDGVTVADSARDFASEMLRLHDDSVLWQSLSQAAVAQAERLWGATACQTRVGGLLAELGLSVPAVPRKAKLFTNPL